MIRNDDWKRCRVSLASKEGKPPTLRNRDGDNQEFRVWEALMELGGQGLMLDSIVAECDRRGYRASVPTRDSVIWHLKNLAKPDRNIVKIEF
jgi:hypothetical protein